MDLRITAGTEEAAAIVKARKLGQVQPPPATVFAGNDGAGSVAWLRLFPNRLRNRLGDRPLGSQAHRALLSASSADGRSKPVALTFTIVR